MNVSKEWAKLFLSNWNRAVELYGDGYLFSGLCLHPYQQEEKQLEYARICSAWFTPNRFQAPHCVARGE